MTALVDLADVGHRFRIAALRGLHPDTQRLLDVGAIVGDVLAAANRALGRSRADRPPLREERAVTELAHLARQQAVDDLHIGALHHAFGGRGLVVRRRRSDHERRRCEHQHDAAEDLCEASGCHGGHSSQKLRWKRKPMLTSSKLMNSKLSSR
jgi:hypothetical protein